MSDDGAFLSLSSYINYMLSHPTNPLPISEQASSPPIVPICLTLTHNMKMTIPSPHSLHKCHSSLTIIYPLKSMWALISSSTMLREVLLGMKWYWGRGWYHLIDVQRPGLLGWSSSVRSTAFALFKMAFSRSD